MSNLATIDPYDPNEWGSAVYRMADKMAQSMWGKQYWYVMIANDCLTVALNLSPQHTKKMLMIYENNIL